MSVCSIVAHDLRQLLPTVKKFRIKKTDLLLFVALPLFASLFFFFHHLSLSLSLTHFSSAVRKVETMVWTRFSFICIGIEHLDACNNQLQHCTKPIITYLLNDLNIWRIDKTAAQKSQPSNGKKKALYCKMRLHIGGKKFFFATTLQTTTRKNYTSEQRKKIEQNNSKPCTSSIINGK